MAVRAQRERESEGSQNEIFADLAGHCCRVGAGMGWECDAASEAADGCVLEFPSAFRRFNSTRTIKLNRIHAFQFGCLISNLFYPFRCGERSFRGAHLSIVAST